MKFNYKAPNFHDQARDKAISAIKKKLVGKRLSYEEVLAIMDQISNEKLGPILTTYFAAAGFKEGFSYEELYYLTKAMVETGPKLNFSGITAGKHSMGGVAGTRTTMIVVPIIAAAGFKIPKNSTRAITSPAGTADTMEVLARVTFPPKEIERIVNEVGGCIVWGGFLGLAPADDVIIQIEQPIAFESFDKIIVSVMAKQIASGVNHLILDIPVGMTMKIQHYRDAEEIAKKFLYLGKRFNIKVVPDINEIRQNAGRGVGPLLEARDVMRVLEQKQDRPLALEARALRLASKLLDLCYESNNSHSKDVNGEEIARAILSNGQALEKMREIIQAQGGNADITSDDLIPGKHIYYHLAKRKGRIVAINNQQIATISRLLGCPTDKKSGMYLGRRLEDVVDKDDILFTLYATDLWRLKEATSTLVNLPVVTIK
jgi:putative thymidine phosphorylase